MALAVDYRSISEAINSTASMNTDATYLDQYSSRYPSPLDEQIETLLPSWPMYISTGTFTACDVYDQSLAKYFTTDAGNVLHVDFSIIRGSQPSLFIDEPLPRLPIAVHSLAVTFRYADVPRELPPPGEIEIDPE